MRWYEGGLKPENRPEWNLEKLPGSGMIMVGDKHCLMTGGRPNNPVILLPGNEWDEFQKTLPAPTIPRTFEENPQREWVDAIKNNKLPGSNFDYSAGMVEMALIGVLAHRFNTRIEYDGAKMKVNNHPELDAYINESVRKGWEHGKTSGNYNFRVFS